MTNWEMFLAAACYRRDQARCWWLNHTGRCSACPKRVRGPHKLACSLREIRDKPDGYNWENG